MDLLDFLRREGNLFALHSAVFIRGVCLIGIGMIRLQTSPVVAVINGLRSAADLLAGRDVAAGTADNETVLGFYAAGGFKAGIQRSGILRHIACILTADHREIFGSRLRADGYGLAVLIQPDACLHIGGVGTIAVLGIRLQGSQRHFKGLAIVAGNIEILLLAICGISPVFEANVTVRLIAADVQHTLHQDAVHRFGTGGVNGIHTDDVAGFLGGNRDVLLLSAGKGHAAVGGNINLDNVGAGSQGRVAEGAAGGQGTEAAQIEGVNADTALLIPVSAKLFIGNVADANGHCGDLVAVTVDRTADGEGLAFNHGGGRYGEVAQSGVLRSLLIYGNVHRAAFGLGINVGCAVGGVHTDSIHTGNVQSGAVAQCALFKAALDFIAVRIPDVYAVFGGVVHLGPGNGEVLADLNSRGRCAYLGSIQLDLLDLVSCKGNLFTIGSTIFIFGVCFI